jgi:peptidoglycan hydrolase-like protein with peptidoglycan-binding domain
LQQRLAELGFLAEDHVDGRPGMETTFAVIAFQKWSGLTRDGVVGAATTKALAAAARPVPIGSGSGRRIEVLLDRQLALLIEGARVVRTVGVSTGKGANATPPGSFRVFRKEVRSWSYPFQVWLPWASYFFGGIAFHEYPDVPTQAASHGCVRVPVYDAELVYRFALLETPVRVLTAST